MKEYTGKIDVLHSRIHDIKAEEILHIHMSRKKGEGNMAMSLHELFLPYKGKNVKITIDEI
jgi:hypothetical protein